MTVLGQQQTHAFTQAYALLAEVASDIPGATEEQVLWLRGFSKWWAAEGHLGELVDPIIRERRELQERIQSEIEARYRHLVGAS